MSRFFVTLFSLSKWLSFAGLLIATGLGLLSDVCAAEPEFADRQFDFALIGDIPYDDLQETNLFPNMIEELNASVTRIVINDLKDATFFAQIRLLIHGVGGDKFMEIDARPSDAIALALRVEAPIFVEQAVLDQAQTISPDGDDQDEKLKKWFDQLGPDDMGKYKM